ncbi:MAG TPA: TonB-dependent receptor [Candidatus Binatia bacterium]
MLDVARARADDVAAPASTNADSAVADSATAGSETASTPTLEPISISATRSPAPLADPSAYVSDVGSAEVKSSAARTVDDLLRRIPGFSLFRRLGSGAAHPTTQGVSLRGIGPSGTSRALVMVDGVPLNDPFGGWIPWDSIPSETIDRIEVLRGSGASLWGNYAMGGVINVVTRPVNEDGGDFVAEGGERGSGRTEGWASRRFGNTSALIDARWMRSGDYPLIRADDRGPIDVPGGSENETGAIHLQEQVSPTTRLRFAARGYHDARDNGTPYTHNETKAGYFRSGMDVDAGHLGSVSADVFSTVQDFTSTFSSVSPDRTNETPAADQFDVPATSAGGSLVWSRQAYQIHHLVAGLDTLWVDGKNEELGRNIAGSYTRQRNGGATQAMGGIFVSDIAALTPKLSLTSALRLDYWTSYDGFRRDIDLSGATPPVDRNLSTRDETLLDPRLGLAYAATDALTLRSAVYRGFRAPTINEQVRPFRVRNDITEANDALAAEKLIGVEGGFDWKSGPWSLSSTVYFNEIKDPVFNVTVGEGGASGGVVDPCGFVPAGGTCFQRRNIGSTQILGIESELGMDLGRGFLVRLAYLWSDGQVHAAKDDPSLVGNQLPQVPRNQGTIGFDYDAGENWRASLQMRVVGEQYEDDQNTRKLDAFVSIDAFVARKIGWGFEAFVAAENLFDKTIENGISADGIVSIAAPRIVSAGVRYGFGTGTGAAGSVK